MGYPLDNLIFFFNTVFAFGLQTAAMACQLSTDCITLKVAFGFKHAL